MVYYDSNECIFNLIMIQARCVCVNVEICLLSITHTCSSVNTLSGLNYLNVYNCLFLSCCLSWVNEMNWIRYTGTCTVPVYVFFIFLSFFLSLFLSFFLSFFLITCRGVKCRFNNYHHHLLTQYFTVISVLGIHVCESVCVCAICSSQECPSNNN